MRRFDLVRTPLELAWCLLSPNIAQRPLPASAVSTATTQLDITRPFVCIVCGAAFITERSRPFLTGETQELF